MTVDDWKALVAELVAIFDAYDDESNLAGIYDDMKANGNTVLERARVALADPEPEVPTDEELDAVWDEEAEYFALYVEARRFARAVLARWGCPAPEGAPHRITPDDFRRWWRETSSASSSPSPEMLLTANAWAEYCLARWGKSTSLNNIEQYRLQMAAISTAAIGHWKEDDGIHPDYDTPTLRDVAKLYAKYEKLATEQP